MLPNWKRQTVMLAFVVMSMMTFAMENDKDKNPKDIENTMQPMHLDSQSTYTGPMLYEPYQQDDEAFSIKTFQILNADVIRDDWIMAIKLANEVDDQNNQNSILSTAKKDNISEVFENLCSVCHQIMNAKSKDIFTTLCNHTYHKSCIKKWKKYKNSCPICRSPLKIPRPNCRSNLVEERLRRRVEKRKESLEKAAKNQIEKKGNENGRKEEKNRTQAEQNSESGIFEEEMKKAVESQKRILSGQKKKEKGKRDLKEKCRKEEENRTQVEKESERLGEKRERKVQFDSQSTQNDSNNLLLNHDRDERISSRKETHERHQKNMKSKGNLDSEQIDERDIYIGGGRAECVNLFSIQINQKTAAVLEKKKEKTHKDLAQPKDTRDHEKQTAKLQDKADKLAELELKFQQKELKHTKDHEKETAELQDKADKLAELELKLQQKELKATDHEKETAKLQDKANKLAELELKLQLQQKELTDQIKRNYRWKCRNVFYVKSSTSSYHKILRKRCRTLQEKLNTSDVSSIASNDTFHQSATSNQSNSMVRNKRKQVPLPPTKSYHSILEDSLQQQYQINQQPYQQPFQINYQKLDQCVHQQPQQSCYQCQLYFQKVGQCVHQKPYKYCSDCRPIQPLVSYTQNIITYNNYNNYFICTPERKQTSTWGQENPGKASEDLLKFNKDLQKMEMRRMARLNNESSSDSDSELDDNHLQIATFTDWHRKK